jgi:UDP-glucuronate 4-epimerase
MLCLVTGCAGFIGFHVTQYLLDRGERVIGVDNLNPYYDVALKQARLAQLQGRARFQFHPLDVADPAAMSELVERHPGIDAIIHLAAQAGVRYSLTQPLAYVEANVKGQVVLLEAARKLPKLRSLVYASSSSVYGANTKQPFSVEDRADHPVSLYAATKRAGELITESYCRLYQLPCTGLRFFTVYGPWGRPDMAAFLFTDAILAGRPIQVFNQGQMARDFTYVDDIVPAIVTAAETAPAPPGEQRVYNLGNNRPEALLDFIAVLEDALGRTAIKEMLPMQPGDVATTYADIGPARRDLGFAPRTPIAEGLPRFVAWYREYHGLGKAAAPAAG